MAQHIQHVRRVNTVDDRPVEYIDDRPAGATHNQAVAARIVWFIAGILLALLGLRFIFALLGANPSNGIANFIYTTSHPFVAPFFSLFSYNVRTYGVSSFEFYTLVAMLIYALIAWGLARLLTINRTY